MKLLKLNVWMGLALMFLFSCKLFKPSSKSHTETYLYKFPFEYDNQLIKINAGINQQANKYSFILDSGAPTAITDSIVLTNRLTYLDSKFAYDAGGNEYAFDLYKIKNIHLTEKPFKNINAISNKFVTDIPAVKGRANGGLIGANLMNNRIWMIDYLNKEITLTNEFDSLCVPEYAYSTTMFTNKNGNPMIEVILSNSKPLQVMVDLGFNGSVLLPKNYFSSDLFNDSTNFTVKQKLSTAFNTDERDVNYKYIKGFKTGNLFKNNVKSLEGTSDTPALLGNDFLQQYTIIMDFINNRMIFIPKDTICNNTMC